MPRFRFAGLLAWLLLVLPVGAAPLPGAKKEGGEMPAEVHAVGLYEAKVGRDRGRGRRITNTVTVQVQATAKRPVILVLSAYEPVRWEIEAPPGAVAQVILGGYHKQTVAGLPAKVAVRSFVYEDKSEEFFTAFRDPKADDLTPEDRAEAQQSYDTMTKKVKELTGRDLRFFQGQYSGKTITIRPGEKPTVN
jgi:hypothetical protein